MALLLLVAIGYVADVAHAQLARAPDDRQKQIAELEKQIAELRKKLGDLKKSESPRPISVADIPHWRNIRGAALSNDGLWFAANIGPADGERHVHVRSTKTDKEFKFAAGEGQGPMSFSHDSKYLAFSVSPRQPSGGTPKGPAKSKVVLVNLATGERTEFEAIRRFSFSGESSTHLALWKAPEGNASASDLLLRDLAGGGELNLGNVADFGFDKKGQWLAMLIDAGDKAGNGVQLRNLQSGVLLALDSAKASYSGLSWSKEGHGFTCLKEVEAKPGEPKIGSILAFLPKKDAWEKIVYDPGSDPAFPKGMVVSRTQPIGFSDDLSGIMFSIQEMPKNDSTAKKEPVDGKKSEAKKDEKPEAKKDEKEGPPKSTTAASSGGNDKPELVIWHWKDARLQSQQQVEANSDRVVSYLAVYRVKEKKFVRLADEKVRRVTAAPRQRWAIGLDRKEYELTGTLDGRRYQDVYVIDMHSGERKLAVSKCRWFNGPSADGTHFLHHEDGHYYTYEMASGKKSNITSHCPASFFDAENDHNIVKPPTRSLGWSADGRSVFLSDNWDIWELPVDGNGPGRNLTGNGKKDGIRYQSIYHFDPDQLGFDLAKPLYVSMYGEWTKKAGLGRIEPTQSPVKVLIWADASIGSVQRAKNADTYVYTFESHHEFPDYYVSGPNFGSGKRLTDAMPDQKNFALSTNSRLIEYTSAQGDRLQAALHLPANYEAGKKYPTVVLIYEKMSQNLNRYLPPALNGFNPALYTSNGYALLMPDIRYRINDPGVSAVGCVLPALDAAIKTGIVDPARVGLHGHSWGGYQTAFLITQSDAFKAAVAGAPLTNLVSMYSSIYWNTGSANGPIFESSQGRFTSGYWDNLEAFIRNSPVYHAKNVKTPLMLLHNDKDGAVDWNQGIEYFNTLRRLQKPVVMLQYKGENHGVVKPANRKDYTIRMKEFFDHYLMDRPAPEWLKEGIPHIKMEEHLKARGKN